MKSSERLFGKESDYLAEVLATDFRTSAHGDMVNRLEAKFCEKIGVKYAIAHNDGTNTLHSILEAIGIEPGDEVIVSPLTMSAPTFAILMAGGTPVYADIDPDTLNISPESIESRITDKTKAISAIALYGLPCDLDKIREIADKHSLFVYEDNAQCQLATFKGQYAGTMGDAASFSFQRLKHITCGEGGMVVTNDETFADKVRAKQCLGYANLSAKKGSITKNEMQNPDYARHLVMGFKSRMPELCAAVLIAQLENLEVLVEKRLQSAKLLEEVISECDWLIPQRVGADYKHSYWTYVVRLENHSIDFKNFRDRFVENGGDGIYAAWRLSYQEPFLQNPVNLGWRANLISDWRLQEYQQRGLCPVAEKIQSRLLQFKTNHWRLEDAERQADILKQTLRSF